MDEAIINGSGDGAPLGILKDTRVTGNATHIISMTAAKMSNWKNWRSDFFAKIPLGYRGGEFIFAASTVDAYLETMSDDNNNPVFYQATGLVVNDGDAQNPNGRFFGRNVSLVEPDILPDFDTPFGRWRIVTPFGEEYPYESSELLYYDLPARRIVLSSLAYDEGVAETVFGRAGKD